RIQFLVQTSHDRHADLYFFQTLIQYFDVLNPHDLIAIRIPYQKMCASTVIITTLLGTGGTINSVHADSIEQQSKLGIEETDKQ
ncbi:hypothetical protein P5774_27825, partial [Bacillus tropicus]|uniref:hypothetical protein n=1 Tax=Bacillus tropicus TaxID=2026188 RepID=UPI00240704B1